MLSQALKSAKKRQKAPKAPKSAEKQQKAPKSTKKHNQGKKYVLCFALAKQGKAGKAERFAAFCKKSFDPLIT